MTSATAWHNPPLVLYHGTSRSSADQILREGMQFSYGRDELDFGRGFYCTTQRVQADRWARNTNKRQPTVVQVKISREDLAALDTLSFVLATPPAYDFWNFVRFCRSGGHRHGLQKVGVPANYDVVFGPVTKDWRAGTVHWNYDQVSFHTRTAELLLNASGVKSII